LQEKSSFELILFGVFVGKGETSRTEEKPLIMRKATVDIDCAITKRNDAILVI